MLKKIIPALAIAGASLVVTAGPAMAAHDHYVTTPNGNCHQVAEGQTGIDDPSNGGYHRYHDNVHKGAADTVTGVLGHGHAATSISLAC